MKVHRFFYQKIIEE